MSGSSLVLWALGAALLSGCIAMETDSTRDRKHRGASLLEHEGLQTPDQLMFRPHGALNRRKRNILFPSGVKLCSQETFDQAVENHFNYFHLRVCQETVWEAFKIFWDRLPDRDEYQDWVGRCIDGSIGIMEVGRFFSQSEEHLSLIRSRVSMAAAMNSVPNTSGPPPCSSETSTEEPRGSMTETLPGEHFIMTGSDQSDLSPDYDLTAWTPSLPATEGSIHEDPAAATTIENLPVDLAPDESDEAVIEEAAEVSMVTHRPETEEEEGLDSEDVDVTEEEEEEPPSEVVGEEEVFTEATDAVLPKPPEVPATEAVTVGEAEQEVAPESAAEEDEEEEVEDSSLGTTSDEAVTDEDSPEPVELPSEDQTEDDETPTVFLITEEEEPQISINVTPEQESVSEVETELPSQASILTTTEEVIEDEITEEVETNTTEGEIEATEEDKPEEEVEDVVPETTEKPEEEEEEEQSEEDDTTEEESAEEVTIQTDVEEPIETVVEETAEEEMAETEDASQEEVEPAGGEVEETEEETAIIEEEAEEATTEPEEDKPEEPAEEEGGDAIETVEDAEGAEKEAEEDQDVEPAEETDLVEEVAEEKEPTGEPEEDSELTEEPAEPEVTDEDKTDLVIDEEEEEEEEAGGEPLEDGEEETSEETPEEEVDVEEPEFTNEETVDENPPESEEEEITPVVVVVPEDTEGLSPTTEAEGTSEPPGDSEEVEVPPEEGTTQVDEPEVEKETVPEAPSETSPEVVTESHPPEVHESTAEEDVAPAEIVPEEAEGIAPDVSVEDSEGPMTEAPAEVPPDETVVEVTTERTEAPATVAPVETTTKYVVEYNNGNFPDPTERTYETDDNLLGNNGFGLEDEQENSIGNEIDDTLLRPPRPLKDQVLELNVKLRGETFNDALRNPSSFEYQQLSRHFTRRIEEAFDRLPGFKNVYVVEFRPQKDLERGLVVLVHYAITLEVDIAGVSNETLDFVSLQNNLVEKNYPGAAEQPTVVYTITDFRNYITEALHKDNFLSNGSSPETHNDPLELENSNQ